jgi:myo-inositol-1(or 4)-monophosphatase
MSHFLDICEQAARAGGDVLRKMVGRAAVEFKGPKDLVTAADRESQRVIREILLGEFPDHGFLGEEDESDTPEVPSAAGDEPPSYRWIVDPLDGTVNFVHSLPSYSVSIALEHRGCVQVGVVYDPTYDECYRAEVGCGAELNGRPIRPAACRHAKDALVAISFSANLPRGSVEIRRFVEILHACQSVRRLGSAALNLCYIAAGRLDAYLVPNAKAWDVAAGALILREAGGLLSGLNGADFDLTTSEILAAATRELHAALIDIAGRVE